MLLSVARRHEVSSTSVSFLVLAPCSRRTLTVFRRPWDAACWSSVSPLLSQASIVCYAFSISKFVDFENPALTTPWMDAQPPSSRISASASWSNRISSTFAWSLYTLQWRDAMFLGPRASRLAPCLSSSRVASEYPFPAIICWAFALEHALTTGFAWYAWRGRTCLECFVRLCACRSNERRYGKHWWTDTTITHKNWHIC